MSFNEFLNQAWNDHGTQAITVADRLGEGLGLIENNDQIPAMANLVTHVMGEHLGRWEQGVTLLKQLNQHPCFKGGSKSESALNRSIASLEVASRKRQSLDDFSQSDQIRVLAVAASALSGQADVGRAHTLFCAALEKAESGLAKTDPAHRALAVTGNNLACSLEEKPSRTEAETHLMVLAAQSGRKFWEIAGTWLEVERAEYRLSQSYLKAGDLDQALEHAKICLKVAQENHAPALELFFGYEALALVEKARGQSAGFDQALELMKATFSKLNDDDKAWCEGKLGQF